MEEIPMSGRAGAGRKRSRTATAPVCYPITPFLTTAARRGGGPPSISTDYRTTSVVASGTTTHHCLAERPARLNGFDLDVSGSVTIPCPAVNVAVVQDGQRHWPVAVVGRRQPLRLGIIPPVGPSRVVPPVESDVTVSPPLAADTQPPPIFSPVKQVTLVNTG